MALCSILCGIVGIERGDPTAAERDLTAGLSLSRSLGDPRLIVFSLTQLTRTALAFNQHTRAKAMLEEGLALAQSVNDRFSLGLSLVFLGETAQAAGELAEARTRFEESIALFKGIDDLLNLARAYIFLAHVELTQGNVSQAHQLFAIAANAALQAPTPPYLLEALTGLAIIRARQGDPEGAFAWTLHLLQHPLDMPRAKSRADRLRAELAEQLTPSQIDAGQKRVQGEPFDQFVTEALQSETKV
jgi:tetratricopeptide (TPR) repeat protein